MFTRAEDVSILGSFPFGAAMFRLALDSQAMAMLIATVVAAACALPGVFLVLRRMSLMVDAISHAILLGIVLAFLFVHDLGSPWLVIGATATGLVTVTLSEALFRSGRVREDAAIALVFPALFSLAVVLIATQKFGNVHIDQDAVLLGALEHAPSNRMVLFGLLELPRSLVVMSVIGVMNAGFILLIYKELKLGTFDPALAAAFGLSPALLHYSLMTLVSVTAVGAFEAVGSILVVALMITPPATAYLLTDRLSRMIGLSIIIAVGGSLVGCKVAFELNTNYAGTIATVMGLVFASVYLFAPHRGLVARLYRQSRQRWEFAQRMLLVHLYSHVTLPEATVECQVSHLHEHLHWPPSFVDHVVRMAVRQGLVHAEPNGRLDLTPKGHEAAKMAIVS